MDLKFLHMIQGWQKLLDFFFGANILVVQFQHLAFALAPHKIITKDRLHTYIQSSSNQTPPLPPTNPNRSKSMSCPRQQTPLESLITNERPPYMIFPSFFPFPLNLEIFYPTMRGESARGGLKSLSAPLICLPGSKYLMFITPQLRRLSINIINTFQN